MAERDRLIAEEPAEAAASVPASPATTELELNLLLEAVARSSGHDFRDYAPALLRRRVAERVRAENVATISGLQERVLHEPGALERMVDTLTFNPSAPFADAHFFHEFVAEVLPRLRTFPHLRVWVAGCGAADDAYALAILFEEAGLSGRIRIYATDAAEAALERAKAGRFAAADLEPCVARYHAAGGRRRLADYVRVDGTEAVYRDDLRSNIVFAQHNLATDGSFNEFQLVIARHVLAQFNRTLTYRAHQVIYESLVRLGFVGLGTNESLRYTPHGRAYEPAGHTERFHRRVR